MDARHLIEQMRAQRKRWVPLSEGKRVQILLPTEVEVFKSFVKNSDGALSIVADYDEVRQFVCGWEGFTEADLLPGVGASDAVPFHAELWEQVVSENVEWVKLVAQALIDGIVERQRARGDDAKN
jgi:hypothetical protein